MLKVVVSVSVLTAMWLPISTRNSGPGFIHVLGTSSGCRTQLVCKQILSIWPKRQLYLVLENTMKYKGSSPLF